MKPFYLFAIILFLLITNVQANSGYLRYDVGGDTLRHIGFRLTDASNQSKEIDRLKLRFYVIVDDKKTPLTIHFYHDEHGNEDNQLASLRIPNLLGDSASNVLLEFCSEKGCCTYNVTDLTYSKGEQLYFKEFYHLEFYQFSSFKQYKKVTKDNSNWEALDQFNKKELPLYVLAKWMATAEIWTRFEVPFLEEY